MPRFALYPVILAASVAAAAVAQQAAAPTVAQLGLFVYPAKGQAKDVQAKDEQECYAWAQQQTGIDLAKGPPDVEAAGKAAAEQAKSATTGAAVGGAARGAAGGAAVGAIAGDAGEGAAIGAVAGAVAGRRAKKRAVAQAEQQGQQQAAAAWNNQVATFKKAVSACLEGKGYAIK